MSAEVARVHGSRQPNRLVLGSNVRLAPLKSVVDTDLHTKSVNYSAEAVRAYLITSSE